MSSDQSAPTGYKPMSPRSGPAGPPRPAWLCFFYTDNNTMTGFADFVINTDCDFDDPAGIEEAKRVGKDLISGAISKQGIILPDIFVVLINWKLLKPTGGYNHGNGPTTTGDSPRNEDLV